MRASPTQPAATPGPCPHSFATSPTDRFTPAAVQTRLAPSCSPRRSEHRAPLAHQSIGAFEMVSRAREWAFSKGLHDIGDGCFAWLQPDGGWGLSNAGLVTDGEESLLVDTLFDLPLTHEMLGAMKAAVPAAAHIGTVVNTHFQPDHTAGNALLHDATVIASHDAIEDMQRMSAGHDLYGTIL